tara:strand:- start:335 stop:547 length:213 start_codon:yes stop_codon:yes gene_type:complete
MKNSNKNSYDPNQISLGELLELKGKPFKDWREERKYLQEKWGKQGQRLDLSYLSSKEIEKNEKTDKLKDK